MKKENILFAVSGLLVGLIIGFFAANSINRNAVSQQTTAQNQPNAIPIKKKVDFFIILTTPQQDLRKYTLINHKSFIFKRNCANREVDSSRPNM